MKKQKMYTAKEVAKLLNNQAQLQNIKETNIEYVTKKKPVKIKKVRKPATRVTKKPKNKVQSVSQKILFDIRETATQPPKKLHIKKENTSKTVLPPKKEELLKKSSPNFFSKLLNGFKKKRV